jgi:formylmethanofuran dehydrogenase subunit E
MTAMEEMTPDLEQAVQFHGHVCPGLLIGYRAAKAALAKLGGERAVDEELVAIVETDACGVDAIQSVLGCTIGKGNLIFKDYGKQVYTIGNRKNNRAVRLALKAEIMPAGSEQDQLRSAVFSGTATPAQLKEFQRLRQERMEKLLRLADEELFAIKEVVLTLPEKASIFSSVTCGFCGEKVMEPRARLREGKIACPECFAEYSRGW